MLSQGTRQSGSPKQPPRVPKLQKVVHSSKFLMNDIPRGTSYGKLMNSLLSPSHHDGPLPNNNPDVICGLIMTDSRLDDELSVATLQFSDTPKWLQDLDCDPCGFPKFTPLGTLWRGVDRTAQDEHGQTEFIRAVIRGTAGFGLHYAEMLAEFADTEVNIQDRHGRTALHWACAKALPEMVRLCLSVPECIIGLRDTDAGSTAFDLVAHNGSELIQTLFYTTTMEMEMAYPQEALLRILTLSADPVVDDKPIFPGAAMFVPIEAGNKPLVEALISRGVDLTARNAHGDTALDVAVKTGEVGIVKKILEGGSDVHARGSAGTTALHHAVRTARRPDDKLDIVGLLLEHGADVGAADMARRTALQLAQDHGMGDVVALLEGVGRVRMDRRVVLDPIGSRNKEIQAPASDIAIEIVSGVPMDRCVEEDPVGETKLEVQPGQSHCNMEIQTDETIASSVVNDDKTLAQRNLLDDINSTDSNGDTILHRAVKNRQLGMVKLLLEMGINVDIVDGGFGTPLVAAAMEGCLEILNVLLSAGANFDAITSSGSTALHAAARSTDAQSKAVNIDIVKALLVKGANVDLIDNQGYTPLHRAVESGQTEIVEALLASGSRIQLMTVVGETALHLAAKGWSNNASNTRNGVYDEIITALLTSGAQLEEKTRSGFTPLLLAAAAGVTEAVNTLLVAGAHIEVTDRKGYTPLLRAVEGRHIETVHLLLLSGATIKATSGEGYTALHLAMIEKRRSRYDRSPTAIVIAILAGGADIEAVTLQGHTALHLAAQEGNMKMVKELLARGANIEAPSGTGTPLQIASEIGNKRVIEILLDNGARTTVGRFRHSMLSLVARKEPPR